MNSNYIYPAAKPIAPFFSLTPHTPNEHWHFVHRVREIIGKVGTAIHECSWKVTRYVVVLPAMTLCMAVPTILMVASRILGVGSDRIHRYQIEFTNEKELKDHLEALNKQPRQIENLIVKRKTGEEVLAGNMLLVEAEKSLLQLGVKKIELHHCMFSAEKNYTKAGYELAQNDDGTFIELKKGTVHTIGSIEKPVSMDELVEKLRAIELPFWGLLKRNWPIHKLIVHVGETKLSDKVKETLTWMELGSEQVDYPILQGGRLVLQQTAD